MGQRPRRAEQHGRMAIMAAGVHPPLIAGAVRHTGTLLDMQRVEIGAQADGVAAAAVTEHADDPGLRQSSVHFEPERFEPFGDERGGRRLFECGFGVGVDMVPPFLHLGDDRGNFGRDVHAMLGTSAVARKPGW